MSADTKGVVI
jgi:hypothetical protein